MENRREAPKTATLRTRPVESAGLGERILPPEGKDSRKQEESPVTIIARASGRGWGGNSGGDNDTNSHENVSAAPRREQGEARGGSEGNT